MKTDGSVDCLSCEKYHLTRELSSTQLLSSKYFQASTCKHPSTFKQVLSSKYFQTPNYFQASTFKHPFTFKPELSSTDGGSAWKKP